MTPLNRSLKNFFTYVLSSMIREKAMLANLENDLLKCENKFRFIRCVVEGSIIVSNRRRADLFKELKEKHFTPFPQKKNAADVAVAGATDDAEEAEESPGVSTSHGVSAGDYDYLLSMAIGTLTLEKMQELLEQRDKLIQEEVDLKKATIKSLWMRDLETLEGKLEELDKRWEKRLEKDIQTVMGKAKVSRPVPKNAHKNSKKASSKDSAAETMEILANTVTDTGNDGEIKKGRGKGAAKKVAAPYDDDDEIVAELRDRIAAYNFDSSPEHAEDMDADLPEMQAKRKQTNKRATTQKKPLPTVSEISDDEDDIEIINDFEPEEENKNKGG